MAEDAKSLARQWFEEVWNKKREEAIREMFEEGRKALGLPEPDSVVVGPEEFKKFHRGMVTAFPDIHIDLDELVGEGDRVAVRWNRYDDSPWGWTGFCADGEKSQSSWGVVSSLPRWKDCRRPELYGLTLLLAQLK